jgi:hypothetical protein
VRDKISSLKLCAFFRLVPFLSIMSISYELLPSQPTVLASTNSEDKLPELHSYSLKYVPRSALREVLSLANVGTISRSSQPFTSRASNYSSIPTESGCSSISQASTSSGSSFSDTSTKSSCSSVSGSETPLAKPERIALSESATPTNDENDVRFLDPDHLTLRLHLYAARQGNTTLPKWEGLGDALRKYFNESWHEDDYTPEEVEEHKSFLFWNAVAEDKWRTSQREC